MCVKSVDLYIFCCTGRHGVKDTDGKAKAEAKDIHVEHKPGPDLAGGGLGPSHRRRRHKGVAGNGCPPHYTPEKNPGKFFSGKQSKIWAFSGQMSCKIRAFCYFSCIISGKNIFPLPN